MQQYLDLADEVLTKGESREDRTGTGVISLFSRSLRFDMSLGFPLLTTKRIHFKSVICELLWFLRGDANVGFLNDHGVTIWNEWADEKGDLGPIYGKQWRAWEYNDKNDDKRSIDQIAVLIDGIKSNPLSRRHIVSTWNVGKLEEMALPPCHCFLQFYVGNRGLSLSVYQRSCDLFLGVPFNIASYAILLMLVAKQCDLVADELIWLGGDVHIYKNHLVQIETQLKRVPRVIPKLEILRKAVKIDDYRYEDFSLVGYNPHPFIRGVVSI